MKKKSLKELVLDMIFPPRCPVCGEVTVIGSGICDECAERLYIALQKEKRCSICGKPVNSCICGGDMVFERCVSAFCYDDETTPMMIELKNHLSPDVTFKIACMMRKALSESGISKNGIDCITEVAMNKERMAKGRVNCSHELAVALSEMTGIPHSEPPFVQNERYMPQHTLDINARAENADKGYSAIEGASIGKTVLLIDDIVTTGATLKRCCQLLKDCGAERVICLTAATTLRK